MGSICDDEIFHENNIDPASKNATQINPSLPHLSAATSHHSTTMQVQHNSMPLSKREKGRENRRRCDSRAAAWYNVLVVLVGWLGYHVVVQKPSKLNPKAVLPRVPCVLISYNDNVFYDLHWNRERFDQQADMGTKSRDPTKDFLIQEKSHAFNAALARVDEASKLNENIRIEYSKYHQSRGTPKKRRELKPRVAAIHFFGLVFTTENIIGYGNYVYAWCCRVYEQNRKDVDLALVPFPIEWWYAPTPVPIQEHEQEGRDTNTDVSQSFGQDAIGGTFYTGSCDDN